MLWSLAFQPGKSPLEFRLLESSQYIPSHSGVAPAQELVGTFAGLKLKGQEYAA